MKPFLHKFNAKLLFSSDPGCIAAAPGSDSNACFQESIDDIEGFCIPSVSQRAFVVLMMYLYDKASRKAVEANLTNLSLDFLCEITNASNLFGNEELVRLSTNAVSTAVMPAPTINYGDIEDINETRLSEVPRNDIKAKLRAKLSEKRRKEAQKDVLIACSPDEMIPLSSSTLDELAKAIEGDNRSKKGKKKKKSKKASGKVSPVSVEELKEGNPQSSSQNLTIEGAQHFAQSKVLERTDQHEQQIDSSKAKDSASTHLVLSTHESNASEYDDTEHVDEDFDAVLEDFRRSLSSSSSKRLASRTNLSDNEDLQEPTLEQKIEKLFQQNEEFLSKGPRKMFEIQAKLNELSYSLTMENTRSASRQKEIDRLTLITKSLVDKVEQLEQEKKQLAKSLHEEIWSRMKFEEEFDRRLKAFEKFVINGR